MTHPLDNILQEYAYSGSKQRFMSVKDHIQICDQCRARTELYHLLGEGIANGQITSIDEEVLFRQIKHRLIPSKPARAFLPWRVTLILFGTGAIVFYLPEIDLGFELPPLPLIVLTILMVFFILEFMFIRYNYSRKLQIIS